MWESGGSARSKSTEKSIALHSSLLAMIVFLSLLELAGWMLWNRKSPYYWCCGLARLRSRWLATTVASRRGVPSMFLYIFFFFFSVVHHIASHLIRVVYMKWKSIAWQEPLIGVTEGTQQRSKNKAILPDGTPTKHMRRRELWWRALGWETIVEPAAKVNEENREKTVCIIRLYNIYNTCYAWCWPDQRRRRRRRARERDRPSAPHKMPGRCCVCFFVSEMRTNERAFSVCRALLSGV